MKNQNIIDKFEKRFLIICKKKFLKKYYLYNWKHSKKINVYI